MLDSEEPRHRTPQLFLTAPDRTDEARKAFSEIAECTYLHKNIGGLGQNENMTCDCVEDWDQKNHQNWACGEDLDCINRVTSVECVNRYCSCGKNCQNQRFQRRQYAEVHVIQTEKKGYGLVASADIAEAAFVYEYIGEVIDEEAFRARMADYDARKLTHFYFMMLNKDLFIDATEKGLLARFCNHLCAPNAYVDKWVVGDKLRMGIFAKRAISAGEEITFDYNVDRYGAQLQPCYCGEPNCIKWMGGKTQTDAALLLPDGISEALGVTPRQERQWLKENKHLRARQQEDDAAVNEAFVLLIVASELAATDVSKVMGALMKAPDAFVVQKLIDRIYLTEDPKVSLLIVKFHGYKTLSKVLQQFSDHDDTVEKILVVLSRWPKLTRNKIESSQIESVVKDINDSSTSETLKTLSAELLDEWGKLQMAYRIPKNAGENGSRLPSAYGRSIRSNSPSEPQSDVSTENPGNGSEGPLPEGWREAFDPNTQTKYYYHRKLEKSQWERPTVSVPTGPRAERAVETAEFTPVKQERKNGAFERPRSNYEDLLARREEERLKQEREAQFQSIQEKERLLQELILQSQRDAEEKRKAEEERLKQLKLDKDRERHLRKKAREPRAATAEMAWKKTLASHVPNLIKKYEKEVGHDNIKGCAKDLVHVLTQKELKKDPDSRPPAQLEAAKVKKLKEFCTTFMEKFLVKYRAKREKRGRHAGEGDVKRAKTG